MNTFGPGFLRRAAVLTTALLLTGCTGFGSARPASPRDADLAGASIDDLRADERTLLQDYRTLVEQRDQDRATVASLREQLEQAETRALTAEQDRDREQQRRVDAEVETRRLAQQLHDDRAEALALGIELARTRQELLQLRIQILESELQDGGPEDALGSPAAPPPGRGNR